MLDIGWPFDARVGQVLRLYPLDANYRHVPASGPGSNGGA
jgi:hypothetical protein